MTELILIRHGQTDWNLERRYQGQADIPLNSTGIRQAFALAEKLHRTPLKAVYTSDLQRAHQTARILADDHSLEPASDARLREIHHGEWEGLVHQDILDRHADSFRRFQQHPAGSAAPGGETAALVQQRMLEAVQDILTAWPAGPVAIVSHGLALATVLAHQQDVSLEQVFDLIPGNADPVFLIFNSPQV